MTLGLVSCALVALLLAAGATAAKRERMMQDLAGQTWANTFPYYPKCDRVVSNNRFRISGVTTSATASGNRVCYMINTQDCPATVDGQPNYCCEGWTKNGVTYPANIYKFEIDIKPSCRNAASGGAGDNGPKVILADGTSYKMDQTYQPIPGGAQTMRLMMPSLGPLGLTPANADGAQICFTLDKNFNKGSGECDTIEEFCSLEGNCLDRVTVVESDKIPSPFSHHLCCPVGQPKTCNDYLPATGSCSSEWISGNDWWRNGANPTINALPEAPGFAAELKSKCCEPDCDGYAGQCGAGSKKIPNVGTHPINANNFQSTCCNQDCASARGANWKCSNGLESNGLSPALSWPLSQAQFDSNCCARTCGSARAGGAQCATNWEYDSSRASTPLASAAAFSATCCRDNSCKRVFPNGCAASSAQPGLTNGAGWTNDISLPVSATQQSAYRQCCDPTCPHYPSSRCDATSYFTCGSPNGGACPTRLPWDLSNEDVVAQCCKKIPTCSINCQTVGGDNWFPRDNYNQILVRPGTNELELCCFQLADQFYPFPYCKCEGKYLKAQADLGEDASGEGYLSTSGAIVRSSDLNLPFRLVQRDVSPDGKQMCLDLHYLGAGPAVGPKAPIKDWCYAQKTVHRIEFLSQKECTKRDFKATFSPASNPDRTCEMGVEDQWENQETGIPSYNTVLDPATGVPYNEIQAASKITKIGAYLDKCMGFPLGSGQGMASLIAGAPANPTSPYMVGTFCINMIKSTGPCTNVKHFCGEYPADKPESSRKNVRCEWALMESSNQRCCPVQTQALILA